MNSANYKPVTKGQLCNEEGHLFKTCELSSGNAHLKILVVDQLPVMATQLGCGKRMYHLLEGLVGLGHEVSTYFIFCIPIMYGYLYMYGSLLWLCRSPSHISDQIRMKRMRTRL